jgi:hypothetical protein
MEANIKKFFVVILVVFASVVFISGTVLAQETPYSTLSGGVFTYTDASDLLEISGLTSSMIAHDDGSFAFSSFQDAMYGGSFTISNLYNSADTGGGENWIFAPSPSSSPDIIFYDDYGTARLTAEIYDFTVVQNGSLFEVNVNFDQGNVGTISTYGGAASEFMDDVNSFPVPWGELYMKFNFTGGGATDFTVSQSGTVTGTFSVVPEPVSSILFITGGATLAFRRYRKKKK